MNELYEERVTPCEQEACRGCGALTWGALCYACAEKAALGGVMVDCPRTPKAGERAVVTMEDCPDLSEGEYEQLVREFLSPPDSRKRVIGEFLDAVHQRSCLWCGASTALALCDACLRREMEKIAHGADVAPADELEVWQNDALCDLRAKVGALEAKNAELEARVARLDGALSLERGATATALGRIAEWERRNSDLLRYGAAKCAEVAELESEIATLRAQLAALQPAPDPEPAHPVVQAIGRHKPWGLRG